MPVWSSCAWFPPWGWGTTGRRNRGTRRAPPARSSVRPPRSQATAALTGTLEVVVAALLLGALTTLAAAGVVGIMTVAITRVHWDFGFPFDAGAAPDAVAPVPGYEYPLALLLVAAALATTGASRHSLDSGALHRLPAVLRGGSPAVLAVAVVLGAGGGGLVSALT
jgi:putative oxidoreductase